MQSIYLLPQQSSISSSAMETIIPSTLRQMKCPSRQSRANLISLATSKRPLLSFIANFLRKELQLCKLSVFVLFVCSNKSSADVIPFGHCFSATHLRSRDRTLNHAVYPAIHYPEVYVLKGGYAECWNAFPERCDPKGYVQMDDPRHLKARASDLGELRRKRLGTRAKSYTFGENIFSKHPTVKHLSAVALKGATSSKNIVTSSQISNLSTASHAFNVQHFSGVINTAELCIHEEEHDEEQENDTVNNSSGDVEGEEDDTSFRATKHASLAQLGQNSSPCGGLAITQETTEDSPCPTHKRPPKQPLFLKPDSLAVRPSFPLRPGTFARTLQRASTSQGITFGQPFH